MQELTDEMKQEILKLSQATLDAATIVDNDCPPNPEKKCADYNCDECLRCWQEAIRKDGER